jgi:hypothetical protein
VVDGRRSEGASRAHGASQRGLARAAYSPCSASSSPPTTRTRIVLSAAVAIHAGKCSLCLGFYSASALPKIYISFLPSYAECYTSRFYSIVQLYKADHGPPCRLKKTPRRGFARHGMQGLGENNTKLLCVRRCADTHTAQPIVDPPDRGALPRPHSIWRTEAIVAARRGSDRDLSEAPPWPSGRGGGRQRSAPAHS